jgi:site-specific DNA-methyltransferase (adenine-specific)
MTPYYDAGGLTVHCADALDLMRSIPSSSVALVATDPPFFGVKDEAWDNAWPFAAHYLTWLDSLTIEWQRVLKPNGSLYVFASPEMSARVECLIGERFNVLNNIRWAKPPYSTKAEMFDKETCRSYFPASESIIFAEHFGADNMAKGEAGYAAKCDELRGFVFEPLRAYLSSERDRAGMTTADVAESWRVKTGNSNRTGMAGHWFERVQWSLPTQENYEWLRAVLNAHANGSGPVLARPYEYLQREYEDLRAEFEDLRREYEDLRRPFNVTADVPFTDVWTFPTVNTYPGKHPCEKPLAMMEHVVRTSSREGDIVLDTFSGSGTTARAALNLRRRAIVGDSDMHWCRWTADRCAQEVLNLEPA